MARCFGPKLGRKDDNARGDSTKKPSAPESPRKEKRKEARPTKDNFKTSTTGNPFAGQQRSRSLEQSRQRVVEQGPLHTPYELEMREKPLKPKNGDVFHPWREPPKSGAPKARKDPSQTLEIFRPHVEIGTNTAKGASSRRNAEFNKSSRVAKSRHAERAAPAIEPTGSQDYLDHSVAHKDPSARYVQKDSLTVNLPSNKTDSIPQSRSFLRRMVGGKGRIEEEEEEDRLSDVPSDVDSVAKDRYILACQMLKSAVTEKEKALQPLEKEFILSLLGDFDNKMSLQTPDAVVPSEARISAVERAALQLEHDPIFQGGKKDVFLSPSTAAAQQRREQHNESGLFDQQSLISKHPHTATRATPIGKRLFTNPCNPTNLLGVSSETKEIMLLPEAEGDDDSKSIDSSDARAPVVPGKKGPVRFNGWKFYKPEEYPFRILGRFDPTLSRVLTPFIMENLRGFFPLGVSESNFWLKFSLVRDAASLPLLLDSVRSSKYTVIGVETKDGEVFGSFTATNWRTGTRWFGSRDAFLWRLKKSRYTTARNAKRPNYENEMEVYPYTGSDTLIQYCTHKTIALGGGEWSGNSSPFPGEPRGIGLMIDGDLVGGETNSCATFANPGLCKTTNASNEFSIANVEVWTLTPSLNVTDAGRMEVESMFVGTPTATTAEI